MASRAESALDQKAEMAAKWLHGRAMERANVDWPWHGLTEDQQEWWINEARELLAACSTPPMECEQAERVVADQLNRIFISRSSADKAAASIVAALYREEAVRG